MQRIEIENFGPIKHVAFDIKDYTIFIGPQASGKSTIAKLVYFFRSFKSDFIKILSPPLRISPDKLKIRELNSLIAKKLNSYWPKEYINETISLRYYYSKEKDTFIKLLFRGGVLDADFSCDIIRSFEEAVDALTNIRKSGKLKLADFEDVKIQSYLAMIQSRANEMLEQAGGTSYIPAGRHIFSYIKNQPIFIDDILIRNFSSWVNSIRSDWNEVENHIINELPRSDEHEFQEQIDNLIVYVRSILNGEYYTNEEEEGIYLEDAHKFIPLIFTSSGQQESLWILMYVLYVKMMQINDAFTVIEEPEAHLFPDAQRNIMYALTLFANLSKNQLMLTTHSPYILTPLNNLLLAYQTGQKNYEATKKIVDPDLWIDPDRFECYYVDNGTIESVLNKKTRLMDLDDLDSVSETINDEFDRLSNLERQ